MPRVALFHRWVTALYAAKLSAAARDSLTAYGTHMRPDGLIQIDLRTIAEWCNRDPRNISRHIARGTRIGLLELVAGPNHGKPATYRARLPPCVSE